MHDPAVLIIFANSLQTSKDPGILYRRFVSHVQALETTHLIGPGIPAADERQIRHIVSFYLKSSYSEKGASSVFFIFTVNIYF